jgi:uncharacterized protein YceH (UPF0502 family)
MLRGPQTPGELKQRAERLHAFDDLGAVQSTLERLGERGLAARLERRPGQKEERYTQLLGEGEEAAAEPPSGGKGSDPVSPVRVHPSGGLAERVERLEARVAALEDALSRR